MPQATPSQQLAEVLLERPLSEYVVEKRAATPKWPWHLIATQLEEDTDGKVALSGEILRRWFADKAAS